MFTGGKTSLDKWGEKGKTLEEILDVLLEDSTVNSVREEASSDWQIVEILLEKLRMNPGLEHTVWEDVATS